MARIRRDDMVKVMAGKDKGKTGKVLQVLSNDRVLVENINMIKRHSRPTQKNPQGGIVDKAASLHISNVMLMDASERPVRVGFRMEEVDGVMTKVRFAKQTGETLD